MDLFEIVEIFHVDAYRIDGRWPLSVHGSHFCIVTQLPGMHGVTYLAPDPVRTCREGTDDPFAPDVTVFAGQLKDLLFALVPVLALFPRFYEALCFACAYRVGVLLAEFSGDGGRRWLGALANAYPSTQLYRCDGWLHDAQKFVNGFHIGLKGQEIRMDHAGGAWLLRGV